MKKLFILLSILVFVACGSGGGSSPPAPATTAPKITNVEVYDIDWYLDYSFIIGEFVNFVVYATDPDLDITTLYVTEYYPSDSATIYSGPTVFSVGSQPAIDVIIFTIDPLLVIGPAGSWLNEYQI